MGTGTGDGAGAGAGHVPVPPPLTLAAVTSMSSTPTHSSCPAASVVITRTWTSGCPSAAAGRLALTRLTLVASPGPLVASGT